MPKLLKLIIALLLFNQSALACDSTVTIPLKENSKDELVVELLKLVLSKSGQTICVAEIQTILTEARKAVQVEKGNIDIQWASAGAFADKLLVPINEPIFRGLTGYRIFVIRKGEQQRFDQIKTLDDLKKLTAGQGAFWGDTKVLQAAGLPVETSNQARKLWRMLHEKRFDYIPLGLHEPWGEVASRPELDLTVEQNLVLVYSSAFYFYVNHSNTHLIEILTNGMQKALADGSYYQMLIKSEMIQNVLKNAHLKQRRFIYIENPNEATPNQPELSNNQFSQIDDKFIDMLINHSSSL